jgi:hypothetical protein
MNWLALSETINFPHWVSDFQWDVTDMHGSASLVAYIKNGVIIAAINTLIGSFDDTIGASLLFSNTLANKY